MQVIWWFLGVCGVLLLAVGALAIYDLLQRKHTILRNFPVLGHLRFALEGIGPELRQYIVTDNDTERPFSRDDRRWVYEAAKAQDGNFGFGTDNDLESTPNYIFIKQATFPVNADPAADTDTWRAPMAKVIGAARNRRLAFQPESIVNISSMSFGALGARAIESLNRGARLAGCLHGTGEGGISPAHKSGGDLILQIGTGYFGARDEFGAFNLARLIETIGSEPVRGIEIKLSQGAKPGLGGVLPGIKVTEEIARLRGIPAGETCHSPARHSAFSDVDSMLDFLEMIAEETGLPVGIKSAVGESIFWSDLARLMSTRQRGVDWITIDGGEGGTGAAPLPFADNVALPFFDAFPRVYRCFAEQSLTDDVVFLGAGRLGLPARALAGFSLGLDGVNVGREAMLSIGCIQAQRCHTGSCPTGVATSSPWLQRGLDPSLKSVRCANYVIGLRRELMRLSRACGVEHPSLVSPHMVEFRRGDGGLMSLAEIHDYQDGWGVRAAPELG